MRQPADRPAQRRAAASAESRPFRLLVAAIAADRHASSLAATRAEGPPGGAPRRSSRSSVSMSVRHRARGTAPRPRSWPPGSARGGRGDDRSSLGLQERFGGRGDRRVLRWRPEAWSRLRRATDALVADLLDVPVDPEEDDDQLEDDACVEHREHEEERADDQKRPAPGASDTLKAATAERASTARSGPSRGRRGS